MKFSLQKPNTRSHLLKRNWGKSKRACWFTSVHCNIRCLLLGFWLKGMNKAPLPFQICLRNFGMYTSYFIKPSQMTPISSNTRCIFFAIHCMHWGGICLLSQRTKSEKNDSTTGSDIQGFLCRVVQSSKHSASGNLVTLKMPPTGEEDDEEMRVVMSDLTTMKHLRAVGLSHERCTWRRQKFQCTSS